MTTPDYPKALAAARKRVQIINSLRPELLDDNEIAIRDLVAALDAQVPVAWPKADDSARAIGWTWDYKWIESLADATRAAGWDASMESIDFLLSRLAAQQPAVAVPATAAECDFIGSFLDLFEDSEPNALIAKRALAKIKAALAQQPAAADEVAKHSTQDCYEHFLAYSGLEDSPWIKYAYFHGADVGLDRPSKPAPVAPAAVVPAANVTPMRQPRADLARLVESIKAAVYANGDGLSVTEAIGALELAKLELWKEQEQ